MDSRVLYIAVYTGCPIIWVAQLQPKRAHSAIKDQKWVNIPKHRFLTVNNVNDHSAWSNLKKEKSHLKQGYCYGSNRSHKVPDDSPGALELSY